MTDESVTATASTPAHPVRGDGLAPPLAPRLGSPFVLGKQEHWPDIGVPHLPPDADTGEDGGAATDAPSYLRRAGGLLLGIGTAFLSFPFILAVGAVLSPVLLWPRTRDRALQSLISVARRLANLERWRRSTFFGDHFPPDYEGRKALSFVVTRAFTGILCGIVVGLLGFGAVLAGLLAVGIVQGNQSWTEVLTQVLLGCVLLFLNVQGLMSLTAWDKRLARECFGPSERELLKRRINELALSRAGILEAVDAERRRIERDLHDGVQQRLVALAMLLGRARRNSTPERADALLAQAHKESQDVLSELREVAWRIYPTALDSLGLQEALAGVAERCSIPLHIDLRLATPLPQPIETAAYFVVSESVTNAAKHSSAGHIVVSIRREGARLLVQVQDNGVGGANPAGSGLYGLHRRVAALDGHLYISSPPGGPTTITAEFPCA
ncbi:histidine kinase [Streptomyces sp. 8N616]|uniref:histidine kinase n=1 Tax=Streptomyces sp. 8N616 TaxID=3457414 RepID=UPI003FD420A5